MSHSDDGAELLELENEALRPYWTDVMFWLRHAVRDADRILDLGAGTGTGAIELAQRFPDADVVALDASEEMLARIRAKVHDLDLAARVHTLCADLDEGWPTIEPVDLTWASMSLHHVADPDRVLRDVFGGTRPGGLLAVAELAETVRFLPDDAGYELEMRCDEAFRAEHAESLPHLGSAWSPRVEAAGFTILEERTVRIDLAPPQPTAVVRYAHASLDHVRHGLAHRLSRADLDALTELLDGTGPNSLLQRGDLRVRGARAITLARRQ